MSTQPNVLNMAANINIPVALGTSNIDNKQIALLIIHALVKGQFLKIRKIILLP
jgi:hypothetical protein